MARKELEEVREAGAKGVRRLFPGSEAPPKGESPGECGQIPPLGEETLHVVKQVADRPKPGLLRKQDGFGGWRSRGVWPVLGCSHTSPTPPARAPQT